VNKHKSNQNIIRIGCGACGATYWYPLEKIDEHGAVECQNCTERIFSDFGLQGSTTSIKGQPDVIVPSKEPFFPTAEGISVKCPHCMAQYIYKDEQRENDGRVHCQNCGKLIDAVGDSVLLYEAPAESGNSGNALLICVIVLLLFFVPWIIALPALVCIIAIKGCTTMRDEETKVYRRDTQGPDLR
jgi:predicted Zn finger-like uncharacterized protein